MIKKKKILLALVFVYFMGTVSIIIPDNLDVGIVLDRLYK